MLEPSLHTAHDVSFKLDFLVLLSSPVFFFSCLTFSIDTAE